MLLASVAAAQVPDGNLVEYGSGVFLDSEGDLVMSPPKMKIFRDGRVLIFDEKGPWQSHIGADRVANLERDLAHAPLLQSAQWIEFARRKPMPHAGGISYIRFGDDVVVATPGIPLNAEWNAILDRVNAERPSMSRKLTSLPSVAPTIRPVDETASTTSGSGLFQVEIG